MGGVYYKLQKYLYLRPKQIDDYEAGNIILYITLIIIIIFFLCLQIIYAFLYQSTNQFYLSTYSCI